MKITYITHHGVAERIKFDQALPDALELEFIPLDEGVITLGAQSLTLKGGRASITLHSLPDGEYEPRIDTVKGVFFAEGFGKSGKEITPRRNADEVTSRVLVRALELERRCDEMTKKLAELDAKCQGHNIFNFERKDK